MLISLYHFQTMWSLRYLNLLLDNIFCMHSPSKLITTTWKWSQLSKVSLVTNKTHFKTNNKTQRWHISKIDVCVCVYNMLLHCVLTIKERERECVYVCVCEFREREREGTRLYLLLTRLKKWRMMNWDSLRKDDFFATLFLS